MSTKILILGAGGHGQVIADILLKQMKVSSNNVILLGFLDDNEYLHRKHILGLPVFGNFKQIFSDNLPKWDKLIIGIGHNPTRQKLFTKLASQSCSFAKAIHPNAVIGHDVEVGDGTVICANTVINTGSKVGKNVIINTAASVDHHNQIADHVHLAPGTHTGGEVNVREGAFVGIGASIMPRITIRSWAIVGAGALVHRDVNKKSTVVGVPAIPVRQKA